MTQHWRVPILARRLHPQSIGGQIALLVVAGIVVAHVVATAPFLLLPSRRTRTRGRRVAAAASTLVRLLDEATRPRGRPSGGGRSLPLMRSRRGRAVPPDAAPAPDPDHPPSARGAGRHVIR